MNKVQLAIDMSNCRKDIEAFGRAIDRLVEDRQSRKEELADMEDVWSAITDADGELDAHPRRRIANANKQRVAKSLYPDAAAEEEDSGQQGGFPVRVQRQAHCPHYSHRRG